MTQSHDDPLSVLASFQRALDGYGVRDLTVTGSAALGVWTTPRQSRDIDVCASVPKSAIPKLLARFDGISAGPGDLPDVLRLRFGSWDVDVFVIGEDPYDRECAARAVTVETDSGSVRVMTPEDLLIHKMIKLRSDRRRLLQDLADMRALAAGRALDSDYIHKWLPAAEAETVDALATLDDEQIARRLLGG